MTREEAIDVLKHNYPSSCYEDLCKAVDTAIEALEQPEIIRCEDCRYNAGLPNVITGYYCCDYQHHIVSADEFCSNAERRKEGDE